MAFGIDPLELAELPRDKPLKGWESGKGFVCVICGASQEPFAWRVTLPGVAKKACPGCAADHGWDVE